MVMKVTVNNHFSKFEGDPRILNLLDKHLEFNHPGAFYIRKKIGRNWDGKVHPLTKGNRIKTGLLDKALSFLSEYEDEFEFLDYRKEIIVKSIPEKVGSLTLRDYQKKAIEKVLFNEVFELPHPRGLVVAAVNAGKTAIFFGIHLAIKDAKSILMVDNTPLYEQMKKDAEMVFGDKAGSMQGKDVKWGDFMVVMVKTLNNRLGDYEEKLKEYNVLLVDEADLGATATHQNIYQTLSHATVRVGFTGTAFKRDLAKDKLRNNTLLEQFGEALFEISMKELEDKGVSTKSIIRILPGDSAPKSLPYASFDEEFNGVISDNPRRHNRIARRLHYHFKKGRDKIIIFNKFKQQTEILYGFISSGFPDKKIGFTHSGIKGDALDEFRKGNLNVLITSLYLKRGLNLPEIQVIINNSAGEFYSNPLQILGRGTRLHSSKTVVYFEDFFDQGKYLTKHSKRRLSYYKKEGLTIEDLRE